MLKQESEQNAEIDQNETGTFGIQWLVGAGNNNAGAIALGNYSGTSSLSSLATTALSATGAAGGAAGSPWELALGSRNGMSLLSR